MNEKMRIIQEQDSETQDQILAELRARGVQSTQATISRDIKQLHLVKELTGYGSYRYAVSERKASLNFAGRLRTFLPPQVEITTDGAPFSGDETLLTALAVNLAENALRASGSEPRVRVRLARDGAAERLTGSVEGCGIPADQLPLIFDPFYRVNKARSRRDGGAGLGLALCRLICERHGGTISAESEVGRGTTVTAVILQLDDNSRTT